MRNLVSYAASAVVMSALGAHAGGIAEPAAPPAVISPAPVTEAFEGGYVALSFGQVRGGFDDTPGGSFTLEDGTAFGARAGYNFQNSHLVLGGDLRYLQFNDFQFVTPGIGVTAEIDSVTDLRGRVGYAMGEFMAYGALGYSWAELTAIGGVVDLNGVNYALGVEYNVTDSIFVGLDFTWRDLDGSAGGVDTDADIDTFTLSAGFRF